MSVHTKVSSIPKGKMWVAFVLTMPNNNAWNGRWTGEGTLYARVKGFTSRPFKERVSALVGNHYYNFGDGWGANVQVKIVTGDEKRKIDKRSKGFCGYDWMIGSLLNWGKILAEPPKAHRTDEPSAS